MKDKLLALWSNVKSAAHTTWMAFVAYAAKVAAPVLSLLALIGVVLAVAKYKDLLMKLISWEAKNEIASAEKEDSELVKKEDADKLTAQQLEDKAHNEPNPGNDWYKKK